MELDALLIAALRPEEQIGLRLQAQAVAADRLARLSAEPLEDLARRIIREPQLTRFSLEWRYLLAVELRRMASSIPDAPH